MTKVKAFGERILGKMISPPGLYKKSKSGLLVADKEMTTGAIKPRWFEITSVGEKIDWCKEGDYILVDHGRWTRGVEIDGEKVFMVDNKDCLAISHERPED